MNMNRIRTALLVALLLAGPAFAVEDGLGTNHVQTLRAYDGIVLRGEDKITSWTDISASTLTNDAISTIMLQSGAVTADKIAGSVAGDGLTGGAGLPLAVDPSLGLEIDVGGQLGVDATVVRTVADFVIGGEITFTNTITVPAPTAPDHAVTRDYVDTRVASPIADGGGADQTLRWDGAAWTNSAGLLLDDNGNVVIGDTLTVVGTVTLNDDLTVEGDAAVEGGLNVDGATTLSTTTVDGVFTATDPATFEDTVTVQGSATLENTLAVTGRATFDGPVATTPSGTVGSPLAIVAGTGIADISRSYMIIQGSGGPTVVTANPQISTTGATPGQMLTLQGQSDSDWVQLAHGNGLSLQGGISFTLREGHLIQFIYDGSTWRETFRTVPAP